MGAALQAGIIAGDEGVSDVLLLDVTPLTLGIETLGGVMTPMIERTPPFPHDALESTPRPQTTNRRWKSTSCRASVNSPRTTSRSVNSNSLASPAPRGVPQIEVCFDIDANGIVNVVPRTWEPKNNPSRLNRHLAQRRRDSGQDRRSREVRRRGPAPQGQGQAATWPTGWFTEPVEPLRISRQTGRQRC